MVDSRPEVVDRAISELEHHVKTEEDAPFVKTCPECKGPIRANEHTVSVIMESLNSRQFTNIEYYCNEHHPNPEDVTERLLTSYGVVLNVIVREPSPDCSPSERSVEVEEVAYDLPPSYDL